MIIPSKEKFINGYIEKCENTKDINTAKELFLEIHSIFGTEIKGFWIGLDSYAGSALPNWKNTNQNWLTDLPKLKGKLINYLVDLGGEVKQRAPLVNVTNIQQTTIYIDIINVLENVSNISKNELNDAERQELNKMLLEIEKSKGGAKTTLWEKVKNTCKWILEKGIETTIATLPYLLGIIK